MHRIIRAIKAGWDWLGRLTDHYGRVSFLLPIPSAAVVFGALTGWLGTVSAISIAIGFAFFVLGVSLMVKSVRRNNRVGTFIPEGYSATVTGDPHGRGEWVPPGYEVTFGKGTYTDDHGNAFSGKENRAYNSTGATVGGHGGTSGMKPYKIRLPKPSTDSQP